MKESASAFNVCAVLFAPHRRLIPARLGNAGLRRRCTPIVGGRLRHRKCAIYAAPRRYKRKASTSSRKTVQDLDGATKASPDAARGRPKRGGSRRSWRGPTPLSSLVWHRSRGHGNCIPLPRTIRFVSICASIKDLPAKFASPPARHQTIHCPIEPRIFTPRFHAVCTPEFQAYSTIDVTHEKSD